MNIRDQLEQVDPEILIIPDCDAAFVGVVRRCGQPPFAVYDFDLLVEVFVGQGLSYEAALDHIAFNIEGSWVGPYTPAILRKDKQ